jgi:tetratricopeptide (TPR) repeat protein
MRKVLLLGFLFPLLLTTPLRADPRSSFEEGLRLYRQNDMTGAISHWERVLRQGAVSGPLLFNLGNAYYRSGEIGKSILCYERARKLVPRDRDVETNLDLARLAVVDKIEKPVRLVIWDWVDSARDSFSVHELALAFLVMGFLALGGFLGWRFAPASWRRGLGVVMVILVVVYVVSGAWYGWRAASDSQNYALVMAVKTDACSAPDASSKQLFSLHEGTKVRYGEVLSGWVSVQLADGRKGWVRLGDVERI